MNVPTMVPPDVIEDLGSVLQGATVVTAAVIVLVALGLGTLVAVCSVVAAKNPRLASLAAGSGLGPPTAVPITIVGVRGQPHTAGTGSSDDLDGHAITVAWRFHQALTAGLEVEQALELAHNSDVDVHRITELIERGCPADLARRIVAPLGPTEPAR